MTIERVIHLYRAGHLTSVEAMDTIILIVDSDNGSQTQTPTVKSTRGTAYSTNQFNDLPADFGPYS